jgi:hypothetical protein
MLRHTHNGTDHTRQMHKGGKVLVFIILPKYNDNPKFVRVRNKLLHVLRPASSLSQIRSGRNNQEETKRGDHDMGTSDPGVAILVKGYDTLVSAGSFYSRYKRVALRNTL